MSHYKVLGVAKDATAEQIKAAYKKLAQEHHPDRDTGDINKFQAIQKAYEVLSDPVRREQYDLSSTDTVFEYRTAALEFIAARLPMVIGMGHPNPINSMLMVIVSEQQTDIALGEVQNWLKNARKMRDRMKSKGAENPLDGIIEHAIRKEVIRKQNFMNGQAALKHAHEILSDYDWEGNEPAPWDAIGSRSPDSLGIFGQMPNNTIQSTHKARSTLWFTVALNQIDLNSSYKSTTYKEH
jgi:curved DNA-binding protein CbpA